MIYFSDLIRPDALINLFKRKRTVNGVRAINIFNIIVLRKILLRTVAEIIVKHFATARSEQSVIGKFIHYLDMAHESLLSY